MAVNITTLPEDLLLKIFKNLCYKSLLSANIVCRKWNKLFEGEFGKELCMDQCEKAGILTEESGTLIGDNVINLRRAIENAKPPLSPKQIIRKFTRYYIVFKYYSCEICRKEDSRVSYTWCEHSFLYDY